MQPTRPPGTSDVADQVDTAAPATSEPPPAGGGRDRHRRGRPPDRRRSPNRPRDRGGDGRAGKPDRLEPECALAYTAGAGDSWYRIAEAAGVSPGALMDANLAGLETPIFPGDEICLPEGATIPSTLTTTTAPPASTTVAPTTTVQPATTTPPPGTRLALAAWQEPDP